jgi:LEA14-like dessication related protein
MRPRIWERWDADADLSAIIACMIDAFHRQFAVGVLVLGCLTSSCEKPQPPRVEPRAIRVTNVSPTRIGLEVELEIHNPNSFALRVRKAQGKLSLGDAVEVGTGESTLDGSVPAKSSKLVPAALDLNWTNLQALVPLALTATSIPYTFAGTATLGGEQLNLDVPFALNGQLTHAQLLQAGLSGLSGRPIPGSPTSR